MDRFGKVLAVTCLAFVLALWLQNGRGKALGADACEPPKVDEQLGEKVADGEPEAIKQLAALQVRIMQATDPTKRGQHPKHHGCVDAKFVVRDDIPAEYRAGVFKSPATFAAKVRFSNGAEKLTDVNPDVHGMAIKLLDVQGARAVEGDSRSEQDFILVDSETFFLPDVKSVLGFMQASAMSKREGYADSLDKFFASMPGARERVARSRKTIASPLSTRYWSTVTFKLNGRPVKYTAAPAVTNGPTSPTSTRDDYLRLEMVRHLTTEGKSATFDFCVIPQTDPATMPVEDPTIAWTSTPVPVATLVIERQGFDTEAGRKECEEASFESWNSLEEHRPLGGINRARKCVYAESLKTRRAAAK